MYLQLILPPYCYEPINKRSLLSLGWVGACKGGSHEKWHIGVDSSGVGDFL